MEEKSIMLTVIYRPARLYTCISRSVRVAAGNSINLGLKILFHAFAPQLAI